MLKNFESVFHFVFFYFSVLIPINLLRSFVSSFCVFPIWIIDIFALTTLLLNLLITYKSLIIPSSHIILKPVVFILCSLLLWKICLWYITLVKLQKSIIISRLLSLSSKSNCTMNLHSLSYFPFPHLSLLLLLLYILSSSCL